MPTPIPEVHRYYLNTVRWLAPIGRHVVGHSLWPRWYASMLELQLRSRTPARGTPHRIGLVVEEAVTRYWGPGALADIVDDMLTTTDVAPTMTRLLKAQQYAQGEEKDKRSEPSLLPLQEMRRAIFGSVVNLLADTLPEDEKASWSNRGRGTTITSAMISEGSIRGAEKAIGDYLQQAVKTLRPSQTCEGQK